MKKNTEKIIIQFSVQIFHAQINLAFRQETRVINFYLLHIRSTNHLMMDGYEIRAVFLNISKAIYKLWHLGIRYKLKQNGTSDNLLETLSDFLSSRRKKLSEWPEFNRGYCGGWGSSRLNSWTFIISNIY